MSFRKIFKILVSLLLVLWAGIFFFVCYKTDQFIGKFSSKDAKISYDRIYVFPSFKHWLNIEIRDIKIITNDITFNTNLYIYPIFESSKINIDLSIIEDGNSVFIPMTVTTKKSENKNFYIDKFAINNGKAMINGSSIYINGYIKFRLHEMPIGGYDIVIDRVEQLLASELLGKYPKALHKLHKILDDLDSQDVHFRLDYTDSGMKLNGVSIDNL